MFRPVGFRPFLGLPMSSITAEVLPLAEVFGPGARDLERDVFDAANVADRIGLIDDFLVVRAPAERQESEATGEVVERVARDAGLVRVDALAEESGVSVRQLQRRFADHVGTSPKAIIRRYRLYEAAERARQAATSTGQRSPPSSGTATSLTSPATSPPRSACLPTATPARTTPRAATRR